MKNVLLFGAGRSATNLIDYLIANAGENEWQIIVCDADILLARSKIGTAANAKAVAIDVKDDEERKKLIASADIVISMLPPTLHFLVAKDCVDENKNLLTASYVDDQVKSLQDQIEKKKLLFLCEMGLDPGIDHMSAMRLIHSVKNKGGKINSFLSHCGGLVAPENDNNPWNYKITWNSRNVVLAGKDGAVYKKDSKVIKVPYPQVFTRNPVVNIEGLQQMVWYPNRDSLSYIPVYGLEDISTFIRTTLRYPSFCRGWNKIVNMGLTDTADGEKIKNCKTYHDWYELKINPFISNNRDWNFYLQMYITDPYKNEFHKQAQYLGLQSKEALPKGISCSADIMQYVLETRLAMHEGDKDMIVMLHELDYEIENNKSKIKSSLVIKGQDQLRTAMAKTVGLPLGIAAKLILQKKITLTGLRIPTAPEIYEPVLRELEEQGIKFSDSADSE